MKKKYYIFSGIIIIVLVLFLSLREYKSNYYKLSVEDTQAILINTDFNISRDELKEAGSTILKLDFVEGNPEKEVFTENMNLITVPAANLLDRKFLRRLKKQEGIVVIVSEDDALATHAWLILTRKGFDNIKILGVSENETLRYTFKPETDTLVQVDF